MGPLADANPVVLVLSILIQVFAASLGAYYIIISLFSWIPKKEVPYVKNKLHQFALIVAAHDEEMVIESMVESLKQLDYPKESYDIFVIADNCTDKTAQLARNAGALVYERTDTEKRGKGYALEWMFAKIYKMDKHYDSICIFDADNLVSKNFLTEINDQHNKGYRVVQGSLDSKNPFDTWISCQYSISFWSINRLYQKARNNINLSCQLSGTGFAIDVELLKELGWGATCLTEDMEFTAKLVLNGQKVGWADKAVVFDEKPLHLAQSWRQRTRWMQGHADVASRFLTKLLKKACKERDMSALDCAIYLMQPLKVLALGVITLMAWIQTAFPDGNIGFFQMQYLFNNSLVWWIFLGAEFLYTPFTVTYDKKILNPKLIWGYLTIGVYSLTWVPITLVGFMKKNRKEWYHTKHVRNIDIKEVEKV
ncbi:MAG: glycosyltransferase family 2 protein [Clostridia bacterium]|nr:glycosyltransferase family 2 protein [Clostridia bacterium]